jgi:4-amino-4-deoxy-L-arabinose transferase-like glycosyltransferase
LVSALATVVAGWGLFALMRRRGGHRAALFALAAFAAFPLAIRYGRAFQPDAAMLGAGVAGLACWDRFQSSRRWRRRWFAAGWMLLALSLALKIIAAFLLIPLVFVILRGRRVLVILTACAALLPALSWYLWADHLAAGGGSRASADNRAIWLGLLGPSALARRDTWELVFRLVVVRAFTPLGAVLALVGLLARRGGGDDGRRLWQVWGVAAAITLAVLAQKLHHEYYFLTLAPVAAAGVGFALDRLASASRACALLTLAGLLLLSGLQARSTYQMPQEWQGLPAASRVVASAVPADSWVVAPEALLFQADRRGCRLEWTTAAVRRAAGEWDAQSEVHDPLDLLEYYRSRGARFFADLGVHGPDPRRMALHEAVRRRYKVIVDHPEVIIADLVVAEMSPHAN